MDREMTERNTTVADIARTMQQGLPPTNQQIEKVIDNTKRVLEHEGKGPVVENLEAVLEDTKQLIEQKNADQKLQRFALLCKELSLQAAQEAERSDLSKEKERLWHFQKRASNIGSNLQSAARQLIYSSEFRSLLRDFLSLLQDAVKQELKSRDTGLSDKATEARGVLSSLSSARPVSSTTAAPGGRIDIEHLPFGASSATSTLASGTSEATMPSGKTLGQFAGETKAQLKDFVGGVSADIKQGTFAVDENTLQALDARFREVLERIGNNRDFSRATMALLDLFDDLRNLTFEWKEKGSQQLSNYELTLMRLRDEGFNILAEFTGKAALEKWSRDFWALVGAIRNDNNLNRFFAEWRAFIVSVLERPAALREQFYINRSKELIHRGQALWYHFKDRKEADLLLNDTQNLLLIIQRDPAVARLAEDSKRLTQQAFYDERGRPSLSVTRDTLDSLKRVIIPLILENIQNVPVGHIEGFEENYWFGLDDVTFSAQDLLPENVYVKFETDMSFDLRHLETKDAPAYLLRIEFRNINSHFHNVHFQFVKSSFPRIEDSGVADVDIKGLTLVLRWFSAPAAMGEAWTFGLKKARCHIYDVSINVKAAHHDFLLPMFTKFYEGTVRRRLERMIEATMSSRMDNISAQLNQVFNQKIGGVASQGLLSAASSKLQETAESMATKMAQLTMQPK